MEERLEAELAPPPLDPHVDLRFDLPKGEFQAELPLEHPRPGASDDVEKLSEEDAIVELATLRLERACRDVIDDARTEALMSRIVRDRDEVFGDPFDPASALPSGPHSGPPLGDVTIPPATSFTRRLSARRLAYAVGAIALLAAVPLLGGDPTQWLSGTTAHEGTNAAAVASAVEWRRLPLDQSKQAVAADFAAADNRGWQVNLVERLARQAIPVGEGRGANSIEGGSLEASVQDWQGRAKSLQSAENQLARADGVSLAVATVADDGTNEGTGPAASADNDLVQVVRNSALVDSVVHLDGNGEPRPEVQKQQAGSAKAEPKVETVALASPRPEDVLAAATAREVQRKAQRQAMAEAKPEPRDPAKVEVALTAAPGLSELRSSQRKEIATRLTKGECLATTLKDYFSPVPVLLMRDLVRDLDSEC